MILAAALLATIAGASHASESILTDLTASRDAFLRVSRPNSNEGANEVLSLQGSGVNRAVVGFDLFGITRPSVSSARLVLTVGRNFRGWGSTGRAVDVHPLLAGFDEGNGKTYRVGCGTTRGSGAGVTWDNDCDGAVDDDCASCASAGGTTVGALAGCWFLGEYGDSCDDACDVHGLVYSDLTRTVAGSAGTTAACTAALTALGSHPQAYCDGTPIDDTSTGSSNAGMGCAATDRVLYTPDLCEAFQHLRTHWEWTRVVLPETTGAGSFAYMQRACACRS